MGNAVQPLVTPTLSVAPEYTIRVIHELREATDTYTYWVDAEASARQAYREANTAYRDAEQRAEVGLLNMDIPGRTVNEREERRRLMLLDDPTLIPLREQEQRCAFRMDETAAKLRAADVKQKALRAELAALTALVAHD